MKKEKIIGIKSYNFTFNNTIGKGEFCSVYKSLDLNTNKNAKIK